MAVEIKVPSVGESISEGTIARWLKRDGAFVKANEPVVELETDKATQEIAAPASGVLSHGATEGQNVLIGAVIGSVDPAKAPSNGDPAPSAKKPEKSAAAAVEKVSASVVLSPAARQLVADAGVDPKELSGSGRGGRVIKEDVLAALQKRSDQAAPAVFPEARLAKAADAKRRPTHRETRQRMSTIRQRIAARLLAAQQNAALLTTFNEVDMSAVMALRSEYRDAFEKKHQGVRL
ncbi:MAG: biotin/lipoyl-containing protein, partial [Candidatus Acidiferrum sp.]